MNCLEQAFVEPTVERRILRQVKRALSRAYRLSSNHARRLANSSKARSALREPLLQLATMTGGLDLIVQRTEAEVLAHDHANWIKRIIDWLYENREEILRIVQIVVSVLIVFIDPPPAVASGEV